MATLAGAYSALATFAGTVSGMTHSFDLTNIPEKVSREQLPCAIVIPESWQMNSNTFQGNAYIVDFSIKQLVLYQASENTRYHVVFPNLIAFADTYIATLKASPFLGSTTAPPIHAPAAPKVAFGVYEWGGVNYHGFELTFSNLKINL